MTKTEQRYIYRTTVRLCEEKTRVVKGWKDNPEAQAQFEYEKLGWFLVVEAFPHVAFPLGADKPDPLPVIGGAVEVAVTFK
jgi:hypothetical protein